MKKTWILIFAGTQLVGCVLPFLANVHSSVGPLLLGALLTLPGCLLINLIPRMSVMPDWAQCFLVVAINFGVWAGIGYAVKKTEGRDLFL